MIVPNGKTIYFGSRRFLPGEVLPEHIMIEIPVMTKKQANLKAKKESVSKTKRYRKKRF